MKYKSKKGTVINIPDGLSAKDIAKIKADADAGYGTRAQKTADSLGKKVSSSNGAANTTETQNLNGVVDTTTGTVDPVAASKAIGESEKQDITTNFNLSQPKTITDQYGNKRTITRDPVTGEVTVQDEAGGTAQKFKSLAEAAASTFNGDVSRSNAEKATYSTITRDYDARKAKELEDQKQEFANRGIEYNPAAAQDPNTKDLYGRTIGGIDRKYKDMYDQASQQSVLAGNQAYATDASARDSFLNAVTSGASTFGGNFGQYSNSVQTDSSGDNKDLIGLSSAAFLNKYGIDKDTYIKNKALNKPSGGGGGGSGQATGGGSGFEIIG